MSNGFVAAAAGGTSLSIVRNVGRDGEVHLIKDIVLILRDRMCF